MTLRIVLIIILFFLEIHSQTFLSGELSGFYPGYDYIVQGTIHVLPGKIARFGPGSRVYFDLYSGIIVHGNLVCEGSKDSVILFSSVKERSYPETNIKPEPFDWNGIQVKSSSDTVILSYTKMSYSSLGIAVESESTYVKLHAVQFSMNGSNNFSRGDRVVPFADYVEIDYSTERSDSQMLKKSIVQKSHVNKKRKSDTRKTLRVISIISTSLIALSGGAVWIAGNAKAQHYHDIYMQQTTPDNAVTYRKKRDKCVYIRNKGAGFCIVGSLTFPINFFFKKKRNKYDTEPKDNKNLE